jgi:hypothetical protein
VVQYRGHATQRGRGDAARFTPRDPCETAH